MFEVMIVDDEPSVLEALSLTIPWSQLDVEYVHLARSGFEALELLRKHSIDIVITDIYMPGMSGLDLLNDIQKNWRGTKCIILSGYAEFQLAREAIHLQTDDYLLKPISNDELVAVVRKVQEKLRREWEEMSSYQQAMATLREYRPLLSGQLLEDLLQGRDIPMGQLGEKLNFLGISFQVGDSVAMMAVRLENGYSDSGREGVNLFEFSVRKITEDVFGPYFNLWYCKDAHDLLVCALMLKPESISELFPAGDAAGDGRQQLVEKLADHLQKSVQSGNAGHISLTVSRWGRFPEEIRALYELSIAMMRERIGSDGNFFFTMRDESVSPMPISLDELYRVPLLRSILEMGRWTEAEARLQMIFEEITQKYGDSREHILEAFGSIGSAFSGIAHQNGHSLSNIIGQDFQMMGRGGDFRTVDQLRSWSFRVLNLMRDDIARYMVKSRTSIVNQVREYAGAHLAEDVSLVTIADHVHLHPVYLSKVFKLEAGEALSDYLFHLRMERAAHALRHTDSKIFEIAKQVGYESTYFMKVFKRHYGKTPQEYREG